MPPANGTPSNAVAALASVLGALPFQCYYGLNHWIVPPIKLADLAWESTQLC